MRELPRVNVSTIYSLHRKYRYKVNKKKKDKLKEDEVYKWLVENK